MPANALPCMADPELWFSRFPSDQVKAAAVCEGCPIQSKCARMGETEEFGVWGGTFPSSPKRAAYITRIRREQKEADRLELVANVQAMTADGMSRSQIAAELGVSEPTVSRIRAAA